MRRLTAELGRSTDDPAAQRRRWVPPRWWRPVMRTAKVAAALVIGAGVPAWAWSSGAAASAAAAVGETFVAYTAEAGLRVEDVLVEGRTYTSPADLLAALEVKRGDPILGVDLEAAKERVEALPWVSDAAIERRLPGVLRLHISERKAIAMWQNQGEFILVDGTGTPIPDAVGETEELPLVVGDDAPQHAAELIAMMATEPQLMHRVKAAVRVSGRRWNLMFDRLDGITVRLPEDNPGAAWQRLAKLEREHALLDRAVTAVDLRVPNQLLVRREGHDQPPPAKGKKPTGKDA